jgi:CBS domain-containing protein
MKIKDQAEYKSKPKPVTVKANDTVSEAVDMMTQKSIGAVGVVDKDNILIGIMTERDLMTRLLAKKKDPQKTKVSEIMTAEVRVADENDNLLEWLRIMSNERFRHLPVVDEKGRIVNMMSQGDFVSYTWPELMGRVKETAKASFNAGYQIFFIVGALLAYALIVKLIS